MPRAKQTMDGNTAAAHVAYAYTDVAAIYPITPSSPMADSVDQWSAAGQKNIFGNQVKVVEMESEAGAAGAVHGSLGAGAVTTTFTASQGLLLMIPNMYKIAAEQLPCVFDVSARTVATQSLNIFGDHSDVMACRQTGFAMLVESSVQEVMDLSPVAHLCAIEGKVPFLNFFDGFRTSHEYQKIEKWDYADLKEMCNMEAVEEFRKKALNPESPKMRGSHENGDVFFQHREACNSVYNALPAVVEKYMAKINAKLGTNYDLFNYYGAADADRVIVAMGSICDVADEVIDYLNAKGEKVGIIKVRLYRPWVSSALLKVLPKTAKKVAVLDRTKEPGSLGEPLYLDVAATLREAGLNDIVLTGGRYGLGSKDTPPSSIFALYKELEKDQPKERFTLGITDDVTFLSLPEVKPAPITAAAGTKECKFWGLGGDGTVGANKNAISTIGFVGGKYAQAYFSYDTMKSGGLTQSHLRFGDEPIRSTYLVSSADFVAVHAPTYVNKYDTTEDLKEGGTFLLNCPWTVEELDAHLPAKMKRDLARKHANFYIIDAAKLAQEIGLGKRTNNILQGAFFALTKVIPMDLAIEDMKKNNYNSYFKKAGQKIVDLNDQAVDLGVSAAVKVEIPASWADAQDAPVAEPKGLTPFVRDIVMPMDRQKGDQLPVSVFQKYGVLDGTWENGTSVFSKRGVATKVPKWDGSKCIQCNRCSMCCPHAAIRPVLLTEEEKKSVPAGFETVPAKGLGKDSPYSFRMQVSPYDCLGCGVCLTACPAEGALTMTSFEDMKPEQTLFDEVAMNESYLKKDVINDKSVKNVQFAKPYFQFSAACAGCAETTYIKLLSQLFGDRMYIGNAAGCSSAISGGAPILPYCKDCQGHGPAWEHSLFEDNAEFAYGFFHAQDSIRKELLIRLETIKAAGIAVEAVEAYENGWKKTETSRIVTDALIAALEQAEQTEDVKYVLENKEYLAKKSVWAVGGDGWAYDIGYGGIDHVMAQNRDVNLMVLDTEVYSNTGGQSSKSTPTSATAKFAASGKRVAKKDLGAMLMQYGYVYVAQVAMGADQAQTLKALREAESYDGPSIVICYCPCLEQHIKAGMGTSQDEMKKAVECGYWHLYRYDPRRIAEGKNPFQLDSKEPDTDKLMDFLMGENRFASLKNNFPDKADALYAKEVEDVKARYAKYKKLAEG